MSDQLALFDGEVLGPRPLIVMQHHFGRARKTMWRAIQEGIGTYTMTRVLSGTPCPLHQDVECRDMRCILHDVREFWLRRRCPLCKGEVVFKRHGDLFIAETICPVGAQPRKKPERKPEKGGYVYFIAEENGETVKIGFSASPPQGRLKALQTGHPSTLRLLGYVRGEVSDERALHREFRRYHVRGEWFRHSGKLAAYIKQNCRGRGSG